MAIQAELQPGISLTPSVSLNITKDEDLEYIKRLSKLRHAYPPLQSFLRRLREDDDEGRKIVQQAHLDRFERLPGRCALLIFHKDKVEHKEFSNVEDLYTYLTSPTPGDGEKQCRLWILEDLSPTWLDVLGTHFNVDPLVFSEQVNTWNFTDSGSIPHRELPSMVRPSKSFSLRYYEFRQLKDKDSIKLMQNQMTCTVNRRRYEVWRDIDTPTFKNRWRHGLVRRGASFWSNQRPTKGGRHDGNETGWDAVMLVDPAFDALEWRKSDDYQPDGTRNKSTGQDSHPGCAILQDPRTYDSREELWNSRDWQAQEDGEIPVEKAKDTSTAYHGGSRTLADGSLGIVEGSATAHVLRSETCLYAGGKRNLSSPLDEMVLHWVHLADVELIEQARKHSVNSAHYLLKYLATFWNHQLDLIAYGTAQSEYFSDDHQAKIDGETSSNEWKDQLNNVTARTHDINYMKRQMNHFERAMTLNLERLGFVIGAEVIDTTQPQAIQDAQKDFLTIQNRLRPLCDRVDSLSGMANDLASLHAAFKGIKASELGLRLSLFASVIFPMNLVCAVLSMGDRYLPGAPDFWIYWIVSVPLVLVFAGPMLFGRKPEAWAKTQLDQFRRYMERQRREKIENGKV